MDRCRELFDKVRAANLTLRPSKCQIGFYFIDYLGHVIGKGSTRDKKVVEILNVSRPENKTQVRSFLGIVNFYRKFIPNMATIAMPLVACVKKGQPNKIIWGILRN